MRTCIEIDNDLMDMAIKLSHSKSKSEVVNLALKEFISVLKRRKLLQLKGKVKWEGELNFLRRS